MSVKKYLGLTAAGLASLVATSAMAGGPDVMAAPAPDYSGFYIDGDVGYGQSDWYHFTGGVFDPTGRAASPGTVQNNGCGGFTWGGDIGYQFNQYFAFEVGAYDLEEAEGTVGLGVSLGAALMAPPVPSSGDVEVESWILYAAGKLSVPIFDNFDIFGKAGLAIRWLNYSGAGVNGPTAGPLTARFFINDQHYATWVAGAGFQYWITPEWSVNAQYLHIPGYNHDQEISQQSPNVNLYLVGAGYKFLT